MKRALLLAVISALSIAGAAQAKGGPVTKQNGSEAVLEFTSICSVSGYLDYGLCGGVATKFAEVHGKLSAVQAKTGRYNLHFSFSNVTPGVEYRLWATRDGRTYLEVGRAFASEAGSVSYQLQTVDPTGLGFDLNTVNGDVTIVTSYWSGQQLSVNQDGSLAAG